MSTTILNNEMLSTAQILKPGDQIVNHHLISYSK